MKQYSPHLLQVPFSSKRAPFFEPQYFFKTVKPAVGENIQMKWYSPDSKDFFLLAVNGLDAQLVKEIVCFLKSKVSFNTVESEAKDLKEMIETVEGFVEIEPSISPVQADTQSAPILSSTPLDATPAEPPIPATGFLHDVNTRIESASNMPPTLANALANTKIPSFTFTMSTPRKIARFGLSRMRRSV